MFRCIFGQLFHGFSVSIVASDGSFCLLLLHLWSTNFPNWYLEFPWSRAKGEMLANLEPLEMLLKADAGDLWAVCCACLLVPNSSMTVGFQSLGPGVWTLEPSNPGTLEPWKPGACNPGTLEFRKPCNLAILEPWNLIESWNPKTLETLEGTLELWNSGTLEWWNPQALEPWTFGTLSPATLENHHRDWNPGPLSPNQILEPWNLEAWDPGTLEPWNSGILEPRNAGHLELESVSPCNPGTCNSGTWSPAALEPCNPGTLELWKPENCKR